MNSEIIKHIRSSMDSKSTEELLKTWKENDTSQYSSEAFEVIRQLLVERSVEIPTQNEPFQPINQTPKKIQIPIWLVILIIIIVMIVFSQIAVRIAINL